MRNADIIFNDDNKDPGMKDVPENELKIRKLVVRPEDLLASQMRVENLYMRYLEKAHLVFSKARADFLPDVPVEFLQSISNDLATELSVSDIDIMKLFLRHESGEYLPSHSVNVLFLAIMMGVWLDYNKMDISFLAKAALFHDIGMVKLLPLAKLPRQLDKAEREEIAKHVGYSTSFVKNLPGKDEKVAEAVHRHHKRSGRSEDIISDFSQIIGLADMFESMTHPRIFRKAKDPHSVLRSLLERFKGDFDPRFVKTLIDNIGLYPSGVWVRLDTDEIALVINVNPGFPISPKVKVMFGKDYERLQEPRVIDLSKQNKISIGRILTQKERQELRRVLYGKN